MENETLHARLMDDARRYDPAEHNRSLLVPFKDVILLCRAKFMSYEQIAATLTRHGLRSSPAAVGVFCRRHFTKTDILRERQRVDSGRKPVGAAPQTPVIPPGAPGKRGPRIARDNY